MDDLKKQVGDLSVVNSRLDKEVADLGSKLEESESKFGSLTKAKKGQDQTVEELKRNIEDETRVSGCFSLKKKRLRKIRFESELNTNRSGKFPGATECKMKSCFSGRNVPSGNLFHFFKAVFDISFRLSRPFYGNWN